MTVETTIKDVLGVLPFMGTDGLVLGADTTRPAVRTWLQRQGWKGDVVVNLTLDELRDAYTDADKLDTLANAKGVSPTSRDRSDAVAHAESVYSPRNTKLLDYLAKRGDVAPKPAAAAPGPIWNAPPMPAPAPKPAAVAPAAPATDDAAQLAAILARMAGSQAAPLDEARVIELVKAHAPKPVAQIVERLIVLEKDKPAAEPRALADIPRHKAFPEVLAAVSAGLHVMLVGPAGSGKTHLADQVAQALETSFRFTGALDSPYKLLGFTDAQGRTVRTPYRETYEHGGVFLFDEIDASASAALLAFNAGLANGQQDFPDACISRHDNFRAIASANTYGRGQDRVYVGRNQLDAASLDRFAVIALDYDAQLETALYGKTDWLAYVHKVRASVARLNIRHVVSMRAIDQGTRLIKAGLPRERVEALSLWKGLDVATVDKIKAEAR
jgi:cobaltochelatase CobS